VRPTYEAGQNRVGAARAGVRHAREEESIVRYLYIALIVAFTAVVLLFKVQNLESVTVTLFSASVTLPVSVLLVGVYVLGAFTGGFLLTVLRAWMGGAQPRH
jgi:uncharacterized integral membrane protein